MVINTSTTAGMWLSTASFFCKWIFIFMTRRSLTAEEHFPIFWAYWTSKTLKKNPLTWRIDQAYILIPFKFEICGEMWFWMDSNEYLVCGWNWILCSVNAGAHQVLFPLKAPWNVCTQKLRGLPAVRIHKKLCECSRILGAITVFKRREFGEFKAYLVTHSWLNDTSRVMCSWMVNIHTFTAVGKWTALFAWQCAFAAPLRTRVESFNSSHHNAVFNHSWFTFIYTLLNILKPSFIVRRPGSRFCGKWNCRTVRNFLELRSL